MSLQWDEMPHLNGALLLTRGQTQNYLTTYGYYPPVYDLVTVGNYQLFGVSAASGRLAAVTFSLLSIWVIFEFANQAYGPKIALLSSIMLGVMPGFFWLSRVAMLETVLIFFFSIVMLFFLSWIKMNGNKALVLTCLFLGVGFLAKYQVAIAGLVMIISLPLFFRDKFRIKFAKFLLIPIIAVAVIVPWLLVLYGANGSADIRELLYVLQAGHEDRTQYSARFPAPVFYFIEMTWPFSDIPVHPVSLPLYILGLSGLVLWAWRRKPEDKLFLTWFVVVFVFFTLIPNKQWRYVTPLFPVLAISAASLVLFGYSKITEARAKVSKKRLLQAAGILLVSLTIFSVAYSGYDAYQMVARDQIHIPVEEVGNFVAANVNENESVVILLPFNMFDQDMLRFYLPATFRQSQVWQYPELAVDAYKPSFNITEFIGLCQQKNTKLVFFYNYGANIPFFNTTLTLQDISYDLYRSGRFSLDMNGTRLGVAPNAIYYTTFLG